jgi:hypothetical protein
MICQVQTIFADAKSQDLYNLFKKEGQQSSDEANYREVAAQILGELEHLFRIEMVRILLPRVRMSDKHCFLAPIAASTTECLYHSTAWKG